MRTTLDIDEDVLVAAKELAREQGRSVDKVVSTLLRRALAGGVTGLTVRCAPSPVTVAGFRPFAPRSVSVSNEAVDALRDTEGIALACDNPPRRD